MYMPVNGIVKHCYFILLALIWPLLLKLEIQCHQKSRLEILVFPLPVSFLLLVEEGARG